jgi:hypothetical protein
MMSRGSFRRCPPSKYVPGIAVGPYVISGYVGKDSESVEVKLLCCHGLEITWPRRWLSDLKHRKQCRCHWAKSRKSIDLRPKYNTNNEASDSD